MTNFAFDCEKCDISLLSISDQTFISNNQMLMLRHQDVVAVGRAISDLFALFCCIFFIIFWVFKPWFSGSQMRLPSSAGPLPRHGSSLVPASENIETSIQNWRETFLNKYHDQNREVGDSWESWDSGRWLAEGHIIRRCVCGSKYSVC